jgi:hypothetical protein
MKPHRPHRRSKAEHYCDHDGGKKWGCYGSEESRAITFWYYA